MGTLNLRGVPDDLVWGLKRGAALAHEGLRDYCVRILAAGVGVGESAGVGKKKLELRAPAVVVGSGNCGDCGGMGGVHLRGCKR